MCVRRLCFGERRRAGELKLKKDPMTSSDNLPALLRLCLFRNTFLKQRAFKLEGTSTPLGCLYNIEMNPLYTVTL